jgi:hypothetical protein
VNLAKLFLVSTIILGFVGCKDPESGTIHQPTDEPTEINLASPSPVKTIQSPESETSEITPAYTEMPIMATPAVSPIAPGFLLSQSPNADCQLPCWQDLYVGVSDRNDVQTMFDTVLGFDGRINIFEDHGLSDLDRNRFGLNVPGTEFGGYLWAMQSVEEGDAYFALYFVVDKDTGILNGMRFQNSVYDSAYESPTPQQIILRLGEPDETYIYASPRGTVGIMIIYLDGIVAVLDTEPLEEIRDSQDNPVTAIYCLDQLPTVAKSYITEPIIGLSEAEMSPLQYQWFGQKIPAMYSIEILDLTTSDLFHLAGETEEPCLEIDYSKLP